MTESQVYSVICNNTRFLQLTNPSCS